MLQDAVNALLSPAFATAKATRTGLNASNDLYHFQMAMHSHGEEAVLLETAKVLRERYKCTLTEAMNDASHRIRAAIEISQGQPTFRVVRDNLRAQESAAPNGSASPAQTGPLLT